MNIKQLAYYFLWVFKVFILKRKIPINGGIIINDRCNLKCKHCVVANLVNQDRSLQDIASDLDQLYSLGIRSLFIVGGEPFLWRDKGYNIDSIIKLAKNKGFFKVSVCTNGILPLETKADLVWVSVDGLKETHNKIRGDTYDQIINNIEESRHEGIFINFTVNSINCNEVEEMVKWTRRNQKVKGILINFHTPYPGVEYLSISGSKKERIVDEILNLKKNGYPILNSKAGLLAMKENNWQWPVWLCRLIDQGKIYPCCCRESILSKSTCNNCGIAVAVESATVSRGEISSILQSFRYL